MSHLENLLHADESRAELKQLAESIHGWMEGLDFRSELANECFLRVKNLSDKQPCTLLFVGEAACSKSELIYASIFDPLGKSYLPAAARAMYCPTELGYHSNLLPSVRLLPNLSSAETQRLPIWMVKQDEDAWEQRAFSVSDPDSIVEAFSQIGEVEMVSPLMAHQLGLLDNLELAVHNLELVDGKLAVPKWRYASINFPHPLLMQGLRVIDTPNLAAFGVDPEFTLQALDAANVVVFSLAQESGVTDLELAIWNNHIKPIGTERVLVTLNNLKALDNPPEKGAAQQSTKKQRSAAARKLAIAEQQVLALSVQQALLGRQAEDKSQIEASGILAYEEQLAQVIRQSQQTHVLQPAIAEIKAPLQAIQRVLARRVETLAQRIAEVEADKAKKDDLVESNIAEANQADQRLLALLEKISLFRVDLKVDYERFANLLDLAALEKMLERHRIELGQTSATSTLPQAIHDFEHNAVQRFQQATRPIGELQAKLAQLHQTALQIPDMADLELRAIDTEIYLRELQTLKHKQDEYRRDRPGLSRQEALYSRYQMSVLADIRRVYTGARNAIELWCRNILLPLDLEIRARQAQLKSRLFDLEKARGQSSELDDELRVLQVRADKNQRYLNTLRHYIRRIEQIGKKGDGFFGG